MKALEYLYLVSSILFILGIWGLSSPEKARGGMLLAALGMLIAIVGTLFHRDIINYHWIIAGMVLGTLISIPLALWIPMTAVPQRTALSHAGGALAAAAIGIGEYYLHSAELSSIGMGIIGFEVILGSLTFTGSLMVTGKLQAILPGRPLIYAGQNVLNILILITMFLMFCYLISEPNIRPVFYSLVVVALLFGILLLLPIGAADMPVVIALLNAYAGLASAAMGFMLGNRILIIAGALDGASGLILSILMCRAMNRSLTNVFFGAFGKVVPLTEAELAARKSISGKQPKSITVEEAILIFEDAESVIIVPGFGMAAAQAHHAVREFADKLKNKGISVKYAIHPVAGRMPGHMNVLLAEADVPYTDLFDMEEINPEFPNTDVALVVGANDVTNPAARTVKSSPIYGMPILDVDKAKRVIVCKRSMSPGFSGIENDLYIKDHTRMLFGDAKDIFTKLSHSFLECQVIC